MVEETDGWKAYHAATRHRPPRMLVMRGVRALAVPLHTVDVLDFGAGGLSDTAFFLREGARSVTALDGTPPPSDAIEGLPAERFAFIHDTFERFAYPVAAYDLINAQAALPFVAPDAFGRVFAALIAALRPGGILSGQFFGDRDDWADDPEMTFHTSQAARHALAPLDVVVFNEEEDFEGTTAAGPLKHWHVFGFVARKPAG
jgi:SAM-dependent methyltransferase